MFVFTNRLKSAKLIKDEIVGLAGAVYDEVYSLLEGTIFTLISKITF